MCKHALGGIAPDDDTLHHLALFAVLLELFLALGALGVLQLAARQEASVGDEPVVNPDDGDAMHTPCVPSTLFTKASAHHALKAP